jgi:hypothetical protein
MGKKLNNANNANRNVELSAIGRGTFECCRERRDQQAGQASLPWQRPLSGIRDKDIRKVEMTLHEQENEWNYETLDLQTMYDGFDTEKSRTT